MSAVKWTISADGRTLERPDGSHVSGIVLSRMTRDDANMVIAASDMYEALEALLNALPSATTHPAIKQARAALDRARGES